MKQMTTIKVIVQGGKANPAPPLGPSLAADATLAIYANLTHI